MTPSASTFLSSPRGQRVLLWVSGAVLVIGVGVFLGIFFSRGTVVQPVTSDLSTISSPPSTNTHPGTSASASKVPPAPTALRVARTFLLTAVARKNVDASYDIVGSDLKGGLSRKQWHTGNIPVTYFPARNLKTAPFTVKSSTKNQLMLEVGLVAAPGSGVAKSVKSLAFQLEVDRIGRKWLVNYFVADYRIPVLANPNG